ncbi:MAG: hypothetical protein A3K19_02960 [Lentisphaerae bacterium RIFOXYB12_FULL_65_16]|nr:MAG: hypothetical protein A3K18_20010 [Lentisphaerae bacterium RIFOXYA12_64_32]OGV92312.1 MAG: hypothetical protein A3K19_02960 [Lentisphaerae bacterium RIFOXYB12_FULL_65_16]
MPHPQFDRDRLCVYPLAQRPVNKVDIEQDQVTPDAEPARLSDAVRATLRETASRIRQAREAERPVMLTFGAHSIKNGLGPVLIRLIQAGWVQHLATNGAGIIHDWEFAFQGKTSEDVRANVDAGKFGLWEETGFHLNLALILGAFDGLGYGEAVGRLIAQEAHEVPDRAELLAAVHQAGESAESAARAAGAADLLAVLDSHGVRAGHVSVPHPWKGYSVQAAAYRLGVPFTGHPMFGHDIIYTHPLNRGAAVGRCAERDFLAFAHQVSNLDGGVYLSIGSAVMSPMIFEKSMTMAQNLALQSGRKLERHFICVVDLAESRWDWTAGEPPPDRPEYYLRYCKTFSRMGGTMRYVTADNRDFLLGLCRELGVGASGS